MTVSAKITSKGQITLPVEMRRELGLKTGDTVRFSRNDKGRFEIVGRSGRFEDMFGAIKTDIALALDEIDEAIGAAVSEKWHERK